MKAEVTNISEHGFWLLIEGHEKFVSFTCFPWFQDASVRELTSVELQSPDHLYWPLLDIDVSVDSIDHPENFPLISKVGMPRLEAV